MNIIKNRLLLTVALSCLAMPSLTNASNPTESDPEPRSAAARSTNDAVVVKRSTPVLTKEEIEELDPSDPKLIKLADSGNLDAIAHVGYCYMEGEGCEPNGILAFKYLKEGAEKGNLYAMTNLAYCLQSATGCADTERNKKLAHVWYQKAIDQGFDHALDSLGDMLEKGIGCTKSEENNKKAFTLYEKSANAGILDGMNAFGLCLQKGIGCVATEENKSLGVEWFAKAAMKGHAGAMSNIGYAVLHRIGCDLPNNERVAVKWFEGSVELGNLDAMNNLAFCLFEGTGCNQDKVRARKLLAEAGEKGSWVAFANLGANYFNEKNFKLALLYFNKVSDELNINSLLGYIFFREKNYEQALEAYERAVEAKERVAPHLIPYLKKKVADARKAARLSKKGTTNVVQKAAKQAQVQALKSSEKDAEELYKRLQSQLANIKGGKDFDAAKELENMTKMYQMASSGMEGFDTSKKLDRAKKLIEFLRNVEEKILLFEQSQESEKIVAGIRKKPHSGIHDSYAFDIETKANSSINKEVKEAAAKALDDEKQKKHEHHTRKHDKPTTQKAKDAKRKPSPETVKPEPVKGPFANMLKPVKKTNAQLTDPIWNNVYKIRDTLKLAKSMDDAKALLGALEGDFDFNEVTPDYAGIPNAKRAFEMRVNIQYRVIIAFEEVIEQVYETGLNGENNNNPVQRVTYKLYGNTIYIDDPHKG